MAKKKFSLNIKLSYDAPVTLTFVIATLLLFVINSFLCKGKLTTLILSAPTSSVGELPFEVSSPLSYLRLFFYVFGASSGNMMITNLIFILLLGPAMEERYGSVVIGIMIIVSAVFAGVLNACFCQKMLQGPISIVFMMVFLNAFMSFSKKKVPLCFVIILILFVCREIFEQNANGIIGLISSLAGGLCGSLFAFLASPKARAVKKQEKSGGLLNKANKYQSKEEYLEELDKQSPRNKKNNHSDDDDETTVVGTLKF